MVGEFEGTFAVRTAERELVSLEIFFIFFFEGLEGKGNIYWAYWE